MQDVVFELYDLINLGKYREVQHKLSKLKDIESYYDLYWLQNYLYIHLNELVKIENSIRNNNKNVENDKNRLLNNIFEF